MLQEAVPEAISCLHIPQRAEVESATKVDRHLPAISVTCLFGLDSLLYHVVVQFFCTKEPIKPLNIPITQGSRAEAIPALVIKGLFEINPIGLTRPPFNDDISILDVIAHNTGAMDLAQFSKETVYEPIVYHFV